MEVPRSDARLHLTKARQFLGTARSALAGAELDACLLNAIHAAISAVDATTIALVGRRSNDPNHARAAELLEQIGGRSQEFRRYATQLRTLLAKKTRVEYEARLATRAEADDGVKRAARLVSWAEEQLSARPR